MLIFLLKTFQENLRRRRSRFENETLSNLRSLNASLSQSIEDRFIEKNVSLEGALELTNKKQVLIRMCKLLRDEADFAKILVTEGDYNAKLM